MIFQILLIAFALFAIAKTTRQYRKQKVSVHWFVVWTVFWLLVIAVGLAPQTTDILAAYLGVERGADLLVYSAIVVLFYAIYRMIVRMEKQHQELTDLVRKIAILEAKKGTSKVKTEM
ncbi:DUF2304 domain-containing protein [Patescibacteria group bacterium]|nr:DUF2304 domain-containing protein [Patescibacteria group bacterium]